MRTMCTAVPFRDLLTRISGMTFESLHHRECEIKRWALILAKQKMNLDCGFKDVQFEFDTCRECCYVTLELYED